MRLSGSISRTTRTIATLAGLALLFTWPELAQAGTFTTFDCSVKGSYIGLAAMNNAGVTTGNCANSTKVEGFVRRADGKLLTFAVPGARATYPYAINDSGEIVGMYVDGAVYGGFVRSANGTITTFACAGGSSTVTQAFAVNASGYVAGYCGPGFVRDPQGNLTTFAGSASSFTTVSSAINSSGTIAGYFDDSVGYHGFTRDAAGNITVFDDPDSTVNRTFTSAINSSGEVAGSYQTSGSPFLSHGYVRDALGNFTEFDVANESNGTFPAWINDAGVVVGSAANQNATYEGFVRTASGTISVLQVPGAEETFPLSINRSGTIMGYYTDSTGVMRGFIYR